MTKSFRTVSVVLGALGLLVGSGHSFAAGEARLDGKAGFAKMKELAGEWTNKAEGQAVIYRVMSKGKSVMEILYAGTDHGMVTMYYLDGDDLVATHYCAQGNQPRFKLDPKASRASKLVFDFAGGTNLDPVKDTHMHAQRFTLVDTNHLTVERDAYEDGRKSHTHQVEFTRGAPAKGK
jgi:hypothetical protein